MPSTTATSWSTLLDPEELRVMQRYARPRSSAFDIRRPALLVVDAVESFVGPDVPVEQAQETAVTACGSFAWQALPNIRKLLEDWRRRQLPVAYSTIARLPESGPPTGQPREGALRSDTVVGSIAPVAGEAVFPKTRPSMFFGTPLLLWLRQVDADAVVVTGGSTSGCVRATAVDAYSNGFETVVAQNACFDRIRSSHDRTLLDLSFKYARVLAVEELLQRNADLAAVAVSG